MNQDDFKKILDKALEPIKQKLDNHDERFDSISERFDSISERFDSISEKLDSHSAALVNIESKLDAYGDMYKINNSNSKKLEKRVETLEENAGITPPSEFTLAEVQ